MLTNNPSIIKSIHILPGFSDNYFVLSDSNLAPSYAGKLPRKICFFLKANWAEVRQKISDFSVTYLNTMRELDISTKWNALKKQLNDIMDTCILSKMTTTRHNVLWINRTLIRLTRKKQRLFNEAKKKKGSDAWSCKKQVTQQMRKARSDYVNNIIESCFQEADTKPFWKFIRSKRDENIGVAPLKSQGKLFADGRSKAEILHNQFKSALTKEKSCDIPTPYWPNFPPIGNIQVNINGVQKLLSNIKANKATGPDNIPCGILKEAAPELAPILTNIFQHSPRDGGLPDDWKKAQVSPVLKKEAPTMLRTIAPFRSPVSAANFWSTSSVTISRNIWTGTAYCRLFNMASDPAIPVSPNSLSPCMTWESPTMRRNKWTSQSLIYPRLLIKSHTNDSWGNWDTTGSPDKPADGFKRSSAIVCNM